MLQSQATTRVGLFLIATWLLTACDGGSDTALIREDVLLGDTSVDANGTVDAVDDDTTSFNEDSEGAVDTSANPNDAADPVPDAESLADTYTESDVLPEDVDDTAAPEDTTTDDVAAAPSCTEALTPCLPPDAIGALCAAVDAVPACAVALVEALAGGCGTACEALPLPSSILDGLCTPPCATVLAGIGAELPGDGDLCAGCPICAPDCTNRECGPDGCGDVCGTCPDEEFCSEGGACTPDCTPSNELCNGLDDDCNGATDDDIVGIGGDCSVDALGECAFGTWACTEGVLGCLGPTATTEACDGLDNDCNGLIDDVAEVGDPCDSGLLGACQSGLLGCDDGVLACAPSHSPGELPEACNAVDDDCDGATDESGVGLGAACSTGEPGECAHGTIGCLGGQVDCLPPMASIETCNGLDDDCNGITDDGDPGGGVQCMTGLFGICAAGTTACAGEVGVVCVPSSDPGAVAETCNGLDDDCDESTDEDAAGVGASCTAATAGQCAFGTVACVQSALVCQPGAPKSETCNGLDDNCDGNVDEGNPGGGMQCNTGLLGLCASGITSCEGESGVVCKPLVSAGQLPEACNGLDDDCDGSVDEGIVQVGQPCTRPGVVGICQFGTYACPTSPPYQLKCEGPLPGTVQESCNSKDDDCNGTIDDPAALNGLPCMTVFPGVCGAGKTQCVGGNSSCSPDVMPGTLAEICNGKDDNCNGQVDEMNPTPVCASANPSALAVSSWSCPSGQCAIVGCQGIAANFDADIQNGCECVTGGGTSCALATSVSVPRSTVPALQRTFDHVAAPVSTNDVAWYAFRPASSANYMLSVQAEVIGSTDFVIEAWVNCSGPATAVSGAQGQSAVGVFAADVVNIKLIRKSTASDSCATPTLRLTYATN